MSTPQEKFETILEGYCYGADALQRQILDILDEALEVVGEELTLSAVGGKDIIVDNVRSELYARYGENL